MLLSEEPGQGGALGFGPGVRGQECGIPVLTKPPCLTLELDTPPSQGFSYLICHKMGDRIAKAQGTVLRSR